MTVEELISKLSKYPASAQVAWIEDVEYHPETIGYMVWPVLNED